MVVVIQIISFYIHANGIRIGPKKLFTHDGTGSLSIFSFNLNTIFRLLG